MTANFSPIPAETFSLEPNNKTNNANELKEGDRDDDVAPNDSSLGGRERLKRHREEVAAGEVAIPEKWGKEQLLKEWIEYTTFDAFFAPQTLIVAARDALIADARKAKSQRLRVHTSC